MQVELHQRSKNVGDLERWITALGAVGLLALAAWQRRGHPVRASSAVLAGAAVLARAISAYCPVYALAGVNTRGARMGRAEPAPPEPAQDAVTTASEESFPASDPPGWIGRER